MKSLLLILLWLACISCGAQTPDTPFVAGRVTVDGTIGWALQLGSVQSSPDDLVGRAGLLTGVAHTMLSFSWMATAGSGITAALLGAGFMGDDRRFGEEAEREDTARIMLSETTGLYSATQVVVGPTWRVPLGRLAFDASILFGWMRIGYPTYSFFYKKKGANHYGTIEYVETDGSGLVMMPHLSLRYQIESLVGLKADVTYSYADIDLAQTTAHRPLIGERVDATIRRAIRYRSLRGGVGIYLLL